VSGSVTELHKEHAVLSLKPTKVRALLALASLAKHRNVPTAQAKAGLKVGETLSGLTVVSRNAEKGLVFVAYSQPSKGSETRSRRLSLSGNNNLTLDNIKEGQVLPGLVVGHGRKGAVVRINSKVSGIVHSVDVVDEYGPKVHLPALKATLSFAAVSVDLRRKQLMLSTRPSRVTPDDAKDIVDKEVEGIDEVEVGRKVRGFVKSITDHGIFVSIGRNLDARVQIKELFDEVCLNSADYLLVSLSYIASSSSRTGRASSRLTCVWRAVSLRMSLGGLLYSPLTGCLL